LAACSAASTRTSTENPVAAPGATTDPDTDAGAHDVGPAAVDSGKNDDPPAKGTCSNVGANIALGSCQASAIQDGIVPGGCAPTVDGSPHLSEWKDAACFTVGTGDMRVYVKYAGDAVYLASIGNPTCGCPMQFNFLPGGGTTLGPTQFTTAVFDDPANPDGDRTDMRISGGAYVQSTAPAGIVTACPSGQPTPMTYEWKIPFAAVHLTAGAAGTFRLAILHAAASWPDGLTTNAGGVPDDPATWGTLTSKTWK
jgi:hypothetical protein